MIAWASHMQLSKGAVVATVLIGLLVLERIYPVLTRHQSLQRLGRNFSFAGLNFLMSPFIVIPITVYANAAALGWRPMWWGGWFGLGLDLLILDCLIYFWHRLNHITPFLWRFHEVHHLDETLDASSALRFHFGEVILSSLVRAGVIIMLGFPIYSILVFETLVTVAAIFHHSNIRLPAQLEKILSLIIVTPSIHWVHHHAVQRDTDSNYSTILSLWDRLFGSVSFGKREREMPIGVEGVQEQSLPRLILRPFYKA